MDRFNGYLLRKIFKQLPLWIVWIYLTSDIPKFRSLFPEYKSKFIEYTTRLFGDHPPEIIERVLPFLMKTTADRAKYYHSRLRRYRGKSPTDVFYYETKLNTIHLERHLKGVCLTKYLGMSVCEFDDLKLGSHVSMKVDGKWKIVERIRPAKFGRRKFVYERFENDEIVDTFLVNAARVPIDPSSDMSKTLLLRK